jgi:GxxExxY protein
MDSDDYNKITERIIHAAIEVHKILGPGLLESAYEACLEYELKLDGFIVDRQISLPLIYKEMKLDCGYRIDMLVNNSVVVELKAVDILLPIHQAQLLCYLRLSKRKVGLLINFNTPCLKDGIKRMVDHFPDKGCTR